MDEGPVPGLDERKADVAGLDQLREVLNQLQMQGVNPDTSSASMTLMTAKMSSKELNELKKLFVRPGFVEEWNSLDARAKEFAKVLTSKQVATPSATWKLLTSSNPEAVLARIHGQGGGSAGEVPQFLLGVA